MALMREEQPNNVVLNVNDGQIIEVSQFAKNGNVHIDVYREDGDEILYSEEYEIVPQDFVLMLDWFKTQVRKEM